MSKFSFIIILLVFLVYTEKADFIELDNNQEKNLSLFLEKFKQLTKKESYVLEIGEYIGENEEKEKSAIKANKIGGLPYLPIGEEYPRDSKGRPMVLLLQVNLKEIDLENYPKKGILEIFCGSKEYYPPEYKIKYFEEDNLEFQVDLPKTPKNYFYVTKSFKIKMHKETTYMSPNDFRFPKLGIKLFNEKFGQKIDDIYEAKVGGEYLINLMRDRINYPEANIGGYADFVQDDPRVLEDGKELKTECLLMIDSNFNHDLIFADYGILYVLITEEDIKNRKFENAYLDYDSC